MLLKFNDKKIELHPQNKLDIFNLGIVSQKIENTTEHTIDEGILTHTILKITPDTLINYLINSKGKT